MVAQTQKLITMNNLIYLYGTRLINTAKVTGILPAGYYSGAIEGSHDNQHSVIRLETTNKNRDIQELPPFTYWHDSRLIDWSTEEIADID